MGTRIELTDALGNRQLPITETNCVVNEVGTELTELIRRSRMKGPVLSIDCFCEDILVAENKYTEETFNAAVQEYFTEYKLESNLESISEFINVEGELGIKSDICIDITSYGIVDAMYEDGDETHATYAVIPKHPSSDLLGGLLLISFETGHCFLFTYNRKIDFKYKDLSTETPTIFFISYLLLLILIDTTYHGTIYPIIPIYNGDEYLGLLNILEEQNIYADYKLLAIKTSTHLILCNDETISYIPCIDIAEFSLGNSEADLKNNFVILYASVILSTDHELSYKFGIKNFNRKIIRTDLSSPYLTVYSIDANGLYESKYKFWYDFALTLESENEISSSADSSLSSTSINAIQNKVVYDALNNKVDKVSGKQLSTEDFTTALKERLENFKSYDDTEIQNTISILRGDFDKLVNGDTTVAIKSFNEIVAFLDGISDSENLDNIIASIEQQIASKQGVVVDLDTIRSNAAKGATALQSVPSEYVTESGLAAKGYATTSQVDAKQDKITDLTTIRNGAALGATALQSEQYKGTVTGVKMNGSTKNPSNGIVDLGAVITAHQDISDKQDKIADLQNIREGAALGKTSLQEHQDISHLATKEELQNVVDDMLENEEVYAAAVNDLNNRIVVTDDLLSTETTNRESLQTEFQILKTQVTENEEVWAIALTDINDRIDINYQHGEDTYSTKDSLSTEIQTINTNILDNEEIIAATLTDLNSQIASLNAIIAELTTRIETLENA